MGTNGLRFYRNCHTDHMMIDKPWAMQMCLRDARCSKDHTLCYKLGEFHLRLDTQVIHECTGRITAVFIEQ
jgi:hypothetical protein